MVYLVSVGMPLTRPHNLDRGTTREPASGGTQHIIGRSVEYPADAEDREEDGEH